MGGRTQRALKTRTNNRGMQRKPLGHDTSGSSPNEHYMAHSFGPVRLNSEINSIVLCLKFQSPQMNLGKQMTNIQK
jgi:hypothetical protein